MEDIKFETFFTRWEMSAIQYTPKNYPFIVNLAHEIKREDGSTTYIPYSSIEYINVD